MTKRYFNQKEPAHTLCFIDASVGTGSMENTCFLYVAKIHSCSFSLISPEFFQLLQTTATVMLSVQEAVLKVFLCSVFPAGMTI